MSDSQVSSTEKLHKVLARIGYGSRRTCEAMIAKGRVEVNGAIATVGARVDVSKDLVKVDGEIVGVKPDLLYVLLNKPSGYITSVTDPQGRPTVVDIVSVPTRVFPVGRLDFDSEGLLILTNDGDLANRITHPSHGVAKEYLVQLDRKISDKAISLLRRGVELDDGPTAPARVVRLADNLLEIRIHEGRKRQVRRMCAAVGCKVMRLVRTRIGPISDSKLPQGEWRYLDSAEVIALRNQASANDVAKAQSRR